MKQFVDFARKHYVSIGVKYLGRDTEITYLDGKKHEWQHRAYQCTLSRIGVQDLEIPFKQGLGIKDPPRVEDVLYAIQSDAWTARNARDFEGFCSEFAYNPDSISALKVYNACVDMDKKLHRFFGYLYDEFMELRDE